MSDMNEARVVTVIALILVGFFIGLWFAAIVTGETGGRGGEWGTDRGHGVA